MNVREENAARAMIQGFLKDSVPEYIKDTGQEILNSGGVHKLTIRKEGDTWDVEGIVQGELRTILYTAAESGGLPDFVLAATAP